MTELLRIRRGLGSIFLAFGLLHAVGVLLAPGGRFYFAHYLFFVMTGFCYLFFSYRSTRVFHYETLADFLTGLAAFIVLMSPVAGLFLAAYGLGLRRGRPLGFFRAKQS
jgi:hypothetical protein